MTDGYVGTEECIWAMIFARFPHLFAPFSNDYNGGRYGALEYGNLVCCLQPSFSSPTSHIPLYGP